MLVGNIYTLLFYSIGRRKKLGDTKQVIVERRMNEKSRCVHGHEESCRKENSLRKKSSVMSGFKLGSFHFLEGDTQTTTAQLSEQTTDSLILLGCDTLKIE